jgi:hypothetical protein
LVAALEPVIARAEVSELQGEVARALRAPLFAIGVVLVIAGVWIGQAWRRNNVRGALVRVGIMLFPFYVVLAGWIMPKMNPVKTYRPQSVWIREQIGSETRFGVVPPGPSRYYGKLGAFVYYAEVLADLLMDRDEVERFLLEHPGSVVLVHASKADKIFAGDEAAWRARIVREMGARHDRFFVLRSPDPSHPSGVRQ